MQQAMQNTIKIAFSVTFAVTIFIIKTFIKYKALQSVKRDKDKKN